MSPPWGNHYCFQSHLLRLFSGRAWLLGEWGLRRRGKGQSALAAGSEKPESWSSGDWGQLGHCLRFSNSTLLCPLTHLVTERAPDFLIYSDFENIWLQWHSADLKEQREAPPDSRSLHPAQAPSRILSAAQGGPVPSPPPRALPKASPSPPGSQEPGNWLGDFLSVP